MAFLFAAARDNLRMVISGVHEGLLFAPGLLQGIAVSIASWIVLSTVWAACEQRSLKLKLRVEVSSHVVVEEVPLGPVKLSAWGEGGRGNSH